MPDGSLGQVLCYLTPELVDAVRALPPQTQNRLEELRMRLGFEPTIVIDGVEAPLSLQRPLTVGRRELDFLLNAASGYSAYAADDTLRHGFLPLPGGHRLGLCGTAVLQKGEVSTIHTISSANLRIARAWFGTADALFQSLLEEPESTLIVGPPGSGKTTVLRDLARQLSDKGNMRVGVADSRGELAACHDGAPQLYVGRRTDVVSLMPKDWAVELLVRVMNPHWVALDEITAAEDVEAVVRASYCGVRLLATAHAFSPEDLRRRPVYRALLDAGVFQRLAVLDRNKQLTMERMDCLC